MTKPTGQFEIARRFAQALDARKYDVAGEVLAANCRYYISPEEERIGPEAILDSYRENDQRARTIFDSVEYSSEVQPDSRADARLVFTDVLHLDGQVHTFRCAQLVSFDEAGVIDCIQLQEIPGERDQLNKFCRTHGTSLT